MIRYAATFDCYIYAYDEDEARKKITEMENKMREVDDNNAMCIGLVQNDFGSLKTKKVDL